MDPFEARKGALLLDHGHPPALAGELAPEPHGLLDGVTAELAPEGAAVVRVVAPGDMDRERLQELAGRRACLRVVGERVVRGLEREKVVEPRGRRVALVASSAGGRLARVI